MHRNNELRVLHIGFPKTGTTWVQEVLLPAVEKKSFCDKVIGQSRLSHLTGSLPAMHRLVRGVSLASDEVTLESIFHSKSFFVSAETFLGDSPLSPRERALEIAKYCAADTTILITVRDFSGLLSSLFQEQVKTRLYTSERQFLEGSPIGFHSPPWNLKALNLVEVVRGFSEKFARVVVVNSRLLSDLDWLTNLGFTPKETNILKSELGGPEVRKNTSLSSWQVNLILKVNKVISLLGLYLPKDMDAREPFSRLSIGAKLSQLPIRAGISLKTLFLVPLLQKFPNSGKFQITTDLPTQLDALRVTWEASTLTLEFEENQRVLLLL